MNSDMNSVQTSGTPKPYTPEAATPPAAPVAPVPEDFSFKIPDVPTANPAGTIPTDSLPNSVKPPKKGRGAVTGVIAFLVVIALGALGYFVIYPMFAGNNNAQPPASQTSETNAGAPATETTPAATTETATETSTATTSAPSAIPSAIIHSSLFKTADASVTSSWPLAAADLINVNAGVSKGPAFVEVVPQDQNGNPVSFSDMLRSLISADLTQSGLNTAFDPTRTSAFLYVDASGTQWIGFAAQLSSASALVDEKASFAQIFESNTNLKNFFAQNPGTEGAWKNGEPATANRYVSFSKSGYAIDYGWSNNTLIVAASYDGYKLAVRSLQ